MQILNLKYSSSEHEVKQVFLVLNKIVIRQKIKVTTKTILMKFSQARNLALLRKLNGFKNPKIAQIMLQSKLIFHVKQAFSGSWLSENWVLIGNTRSSAIHKSLKVFKQIRFRTAMKNQKLTHFSLQPINLKTLKKTHEDFLSEESVVQTLTLKRTERVLESRMSLLTQNMYSLCQNL